MTKSTGRGLGGYSHQIMQFARDLRVSESSPQLKVGLAVRLEQVAQDFGHPGAAASHCPQKLSCEQRESLALRLI